MNDSLPPFERYSLFVDAVHIIAREARLEIQEHRLSNPQHRLLALRDALTAQFTNHHTRRDHICQLLHISPTTEAITHLP
eukprot:3782897-Prorocentrum_lima.AAC.1